MIDNQIQLEDVDINRVLKEHYRTSKPVNFTSTMLWDMEVKKAWDPKSYIPYVVREGKSWGKKRLENGDDMFARSSEQKQWLKQDIYEDVFEEVYVNHREQKVTFIGTKILKNAYGKPIKLSNHQPVFYVEHSVKGTKENPLNGWRIVHLTKAKDQMLIEHFKKFNDSKRLPKFIEIYIEKDLKISLVHIGGNHVSI